MSRHHTYLNGHRWAAVRRSVFERDGWRCVMDALGVRMDTVPAGRAEWPLPSEGRGRTFESCRVRHSPSKG